jgi:hypothetical protein
MKGKRGSKFPFARRFNRHRFTGLFCEEFMGKLSPSRFIRDLPPSGMDILSAYKAKHFLVVENDANDAFFIDRALRGAPQCKSTVICRSGSEAQAYSQRRRRLFRPRKIRNA